MQKPAELFGRAADVEYIRKCIAQGACCSIVGVSNLGKSVLLRHLCTAPAPTGTPVYVDCNQMPERTAQALFTATWRAISSVLARLAPDTAARVPDLTDGIDKAPNAMTRWHNFEQGLALALDRLPKPLVLCLDDFDEAFKSLEPQTFLNLRALRDRHGRALVYVTATERELAHMSKTREQGEFHELIAPRIRFVHMLTPDETRQFCQHFAEREHVTFGDADLAFIQENADGHPGLVQAVCLALGAVTGAPVRDAHQDRVIHQTLQSNLHADTNVRMELERIWLDLEPAEREALLHLDHLGSGPAERGLRKKHILRDGPEGPVIFARLFADHVRRQKYIAQPAAHGVYVDVDAGDVWVDGKPVEALTDLEYRLLLFLYGRLDRVCDKYAIVESVWGQDYVDQVDDARIEKLVSRVRAKIEPDPTHPRYLISLRGRGYKLTR